MTITFNNIPTNLRTPGAYLEVDNSRALRGLIQNPHRALIIGQKIGHAFTPAAQVGAADNDVIMAITNDNLADGFFGIGSPAARMCNIFKANNPNTELHALALAVSTGNVHASCDLDFSCAMNDTAASVAGTYYLMINGLTCYVDIEVGDSGAAIATNLEAIINSMDELPVWASASHYLGVGSLGHLNLEVMYSGTLGNQMDIRTNYYQGQVFPSCFSLSVERNSGGTTGGSVLSFATATGTVHLDSAWALIDNDQYHYIIQPYTDDTNLTAIEDELEDRFLPLNDLQGHGFAMIRDSHTGLTTRVAATAAGGGRNSPHNTIMGATGSPNGVEEWAAALGAVAAWNLNNDPARPLHFLKLKNLLPPKIEDRYSRAERDIHLYDGVATFIVDTGGNVVIERCITTYQRTDLNTLDPSFLDIQTLATLGEIRYQYKARMASRFIIPRFKLADNTFPVQPGSYVVTPNTVKQETIALFTLLRDKGLIENLDEFIDALIVERDLTDRNRVNVLIPCDLINAFRVLAGNIQFIL